LTSPTSAFASAITITTHDLTCRTQEDCSPGSIETLLNGLHQPSETRTRAGLTGSSRGAGRATRWTSQLYVERRI
jgi:hypothetical protein